jgi:hypothetical protein
MLTLVGAIVALQKWNNNNSAEGSTKGGNDDEVGSHDDSYPWGDEGSSCGVSIANSDDSDEDGADASTFGRFPWEPVHDQKIRPTTMDKGKPRYQFRDRRRVPQPGFTSHSSKGGGDSKHGQPVKALHQKEELDFLAAMTFANGGLRHPSCPCC